MLARLKREPSNMSVGDLSGRPLGNAFVVHKRRGVTDAARDLALSLPADPEHDLVVIDLPPDSSAGVWSSVAAVLAPRGQRSIRIVIGSRSREVVALAGQWLSDRLRRTVVAPDGELRQVCAGRLFVHSGRGTGWVRYAPRQPPRWEGVRFPRPPWDAPEVSDVWPTSATVRVEPVPSGVWIRSSAPSPHDESHRTRLIELVPCQSAALSVVVGCPDTPPVSLDDVTRFWSQLQPDVQEVARFIHYGPISMPVETTLGQALATLVGQPVTCYAGLPVAEAGSDEAPDVHTILPDGSLGWRSSARELTYLPADADGAIEPPTISSYDRPIDALREVAPRIFWYAPGAVIEVIQAGLWMRSPTWQADEWLVRSLRPDPAAHMFVFDSETADIAARMRGLIVDAVAQIDPSSMVRNHIVSAEAVTHAWQAQRAGAGVNLDGPYQRDAYMPIVDPPGARPTPTSPRT